MSQQQAQSNDDANGGPYAVYRNFTTFGENSLQNMFSYFLERIEIEAQYAASLERLARKTFPQKPDETGPIRTSSEAWRRVNQSTLSLASYHQKLVFNIDWVLDSLNKAQERQKSQMKDLRAEVKILLREFHELRTGSVPKLKMNYWKKCEAYDIELKQSGASNPKTVKLAKEAQAAEHGYRLGVLRLEEVRERLSKVREQAFAMGEIAEKDRVESTRSVLVRYGEIENQVSKSRTDETSALALFVECIKKEVDLGTYWTEFNVAWSEPIKTGYENYRIREPVMNLVYGLPLDHVMKKFPDLPAPPVLMACAQYIDQKGLDIEGVHRISGKQSDIESLKVSLELNATTVDWEQYDAHAVSSVFKAFLRDLPEPLFLFPLKDRAEYSSIPDEKERLAKLKTRVKSLRKSSQSVLSFVISHLIKVAEHEAVNRVSVQSLSVVYGPILFQSQYDQIENAAPTGLSWFSKQSTVQNAAPDAAQLELLRNDLTLSDLIHFKETLFKDLPSHSAQQSEPEPTSLAPIKEHQIRFQDSLSGSVATDLVSLMPVVNMSMTGADESVSGLPVAESKPETDVTERVSGQPPLLPARSALLNKEASATYISESLPNNIIESDSLVPKDLTATNELIAREQQQEPSSDKFVVTEEEESVW